MSRIKSRKKDKRRLIIIIISLVVLFTASFIVVWYILNQDAPKTPHQMSQSTSETTTSRSDSGATTKQSTKATTAVSADSSEAPLVKLDASQLLANASQVQYGVYYFKTKQEITSGNSTATISASVIKVFIMAYYYQQVVTGKLSLKTQIQGQALEAWLYPMIQQSDNQATNVLIDYAGMAQLNQFFANQGYQDTRLERHMLDFAAQQNGQENYTSLKDCLQFLKQLYQNQSSYPYSQMLAIMKGQQVRTKIPSQLVGNLEVANKTGELAGVENDIGIVFDAQQPFAMVVLSNGVFASENMRQAIGEFAAQAQRGGEQ